MQLNRTANAHTRRVIAWPFGAEPSKGYRRTSAGALSGNPLQIQGNPGHNRPMRIDEVSPPRPLLPRELLLGRLVMIGFVAIFLFREFLSLTVLSTSARVPVCVGTVVLALTWTWFWGFVAAGSNRIAPGVSVGLT